MAKLKLPESLKAWKVMNRLPDENSNAVYQVSKKNGDSTKTTAKLTHIVIEDESYSKETADFIKDDTEFIHTIPSEVSVYLDAECEDYVDDKAIEMFIISKKLTPLSDVLKNKEFSQDEIIDFGLKMSELLEKLEQKNIFHGNLNPSNIYIDGDSYRLGGFIDAESKIDDMSYIAPEIKNGEPTDFTTDIYSVGLIMYYMSNSGKLPFENELPKAQAADKRLSGASIPAPNNGSEKLKSVIVIACQAENANRWKNAGNIRNALSAIKAEAPAELKTAPGVIAPADTSFDSNVFEEFTYDEPEAEQSVQEKPETQPAVGAAIPETSGQTEVPVDAPAKPAEEEKPSTDDAQKAKGPAADENEIDNRVFDEYTPKPKVININSSYKPEGKDYGDFFDEPDETQKKPAEKSVPAPAVSKKPEISDNYDDNAFIQGINDKQESTNKSKKGLIAIIAIIVALIAAIAVMAVLAVNMHWFGGSADAGKTEETTQSQQSGEDGTKAQPTTVQPTTAKPTQAQTTVRATDAPSELYPLGVIGDPYEEAKAALEAQGFKVEIGDYFFDDYYYEGNVISQSPDSYSLAPYGSTVTLFISLGPNPEETTTETTKPEEKQESQSSSSDSSSYSSSKYSTSYLSQAEVEAMSRSELNLTLNEIYARRGRIFTDPELDAYFRSQSWYTPKYTADEFSANVTFNSYEAKNLQIIYDEQEKRGYR